MWRRPLPTPKPRPARPAPTPKRRWPSWSGWPSGPGAIACRRRRRARSDSGNLKGTEQMAETQTKLPALRLSLDVEAVKGALAVQPDAGDAAGLERKAQDYVDVLANSQPNADAAQTEAKAAVEAMGRDLQAEAAQRSKMLRQPIKDLSARGTDGGTVGNALLDLKMKVEELDPARLDLSPGFVTRLLGMIPS